MTAVGRGDDEGRGMPAVGRGDAEPRGTPPVELCDVFRLHRTGDGDAAALQGVSLTVAAGEHVCVLGPSGAGKSTLLRVIAGLEPPSTGIVRVLGQDIGRLSPRARARLRRRSIGMLDQRADHSLPPDLPVGDGVVLGLALRGAGRAERRARARTLLDAVSLGDRAGARPGELSGGERQRLALCSALAHRPALLLADEPTGELDDESAAAVRALIVALARAEGTTVVVVSHDPAMAATADRAVRLRDGRIGEERRHGIDELVVGRGGWVRLPGPLRAAAGIDRRATARLAGASIRLRAARPPAAPAPGRTSAAAPARAVAAAPAVALAPVRLECVALAKSYGRRRVIADLSVAFAPGRLTVVSGRSGSGKSTLLRVLAGLELADAGAVLIDGVSVAGCEAEERALTRRAAIGFLAQDVRLAGFLSAVENVALAQALRGSDESARRPRAVAALAGLGLADRAGQRVSRLSAGERQRVALARALVAAGGILLVDEPTSRLDEAASPRSPTPCVRRRPTGRRSSARRTSRC